MAKHNPVGHPLIAYGGNLVFGPISKVLHGSNTSNTLGALVFGGLHLAEKYFPRLGITDSNLYVRLGRAATTAYYGISTFGGLLRVLGGDFDALWHLAPDALMAYQLGSETLQTYPSPIQGVRKDLSALKTSLESLAKKYGSR